MSGRQAQPGAKPAVDANRAALEWVSDPSKVAELRAQFCDADTGRILPEKRRAAIKAFEANRRFVTLTARGGVQ
jgi:hypothetical protein